MVGPCLTGAGSCAIPGALTEVRLVLDSSAALSASLSAEASTELAGHTLLAPPLLWSEVHSALHEALWRRELNGETAKTALDNFATLRIVRRAPARLPATAYRLASELGWAKTYDAEFLALAHLEDAKVLTTDGRFRRGAARTGLVITPAEL